MTPAEAHAKAVRRIAEARETGAAILDLGDLGLTELPRELCDLHSLRVLALGKRQLVVNEERLTDIWDDSRAGSQALSDVSPLAGLTALAALDLSGCKALSDMSPLAGRTALSFLGLAGCRALLDVSPLAGRTALNTLGLSGCALSDVSPLAGLATLNTLGLSQCPRIRSFAPLRLLLTHLNTLILHRCDFADLPKEMCGSSDHDNVVHDVRAYYTDLNAGAEADAEVKLFVLGNGRVGKTQLVRRLRREGYDERVPTTHGVEWHSFPVSADDGSPVRVNLWDFGGQDIYHGSHALFLDSHAVFVVLWHPDFERGTSVENGIPMANHPLAYWLDYVRAAAGPDAVVVLVQARADTRRNEYPLPAVDLGGLRVRQVAVSSRTGREFDTLQVQIRNAVRDLLDARPPHLIGRGRLAVRNHLRAMLAEDQTRPRAGRKHRTLTRAEFACLCDEAGGVSSPDALLSFLRRTGVVFHNPKLFGAQIVLDQQWALDAIYALLDRARVMPVFRDRGRFTRTDLEQLVWDEYTPDEQKTFLGMMEECDICFQAGKRDDEPVYVAPELLPDDAAASRVLAGWIPDDEPDATATATFAFLHDGILRGLLAGVGREAGDRAHYWRYGCFFYDEKTRSRAVVDVLRGRPTDGPGGGTLRFRGWGPNAAGVLEPLLQELDRVKGRQNPDVVRLWPADRGRSDPEHDRSPNPLAVLQPGPPPDADRVAALSYGHGDDTENGRIRGAFVDDLEPAMRGWGYGVLRDVNELENYGLIREFVRTIWESRRVLLVLTEKYLRSVNCMNELHAVYLEARKRRADFADKVVPCVLEDRLGLDDWEGRANWADHWRGVYERMEQRVRSLGQSDLNQWYEIGQWVRDVTDMLSFVANIVTVRGHARLRANGFAAVRAMLDRPRRA